MVNALREWLGLAPLYGGDAAAHEPQQPRTYPSPWLAKGSQHE